MIKLTIDYNKCTMCLECVEICIGQALQFKEDMFIFKPNECSYCESCIDICEAEAITINR